MRNRHTSLIRVALGLLLLLPLWFLVSCSSGSVTEKNSPPETAGGYRAPAPAPTPIDSRANQYSLQMLDGGDAKLSNLIGNNKVVLVNFWATWCGPCRREIPELVALQREFKDKGVEVVGLTVEDPRTEQENVRIFMQRFSINYKIGFSPKEMFLLCNGSAYPSAPIPQTFIFDRQGRLVDSVRGLRPNFRDWVQGAVQHALSNS